LATAAGLLLLLGAPQMAVAAPTGLALPQPDWRCPNQTVAAPTRLSLQGRLTAQGGTAVADGTYPLAVALYDAAVGGQAVHKEFFLAVAVQQRCSRANPHKLQAKIRNDLSTQYNYLWWNIDSSNSWHPGFDVSGTLPNPTPSEDSFAWHDAGINPNHLCHNSNGEIVWMVR
jgi:hypothetical protein